MNSKIVADIEYVKEQLADVLLPNFTDFDYLRWLQGHDYKLDVVVPKLRHHFRFLRSYDFENYISSPTLLKYWPYGYFGNSGKDDNYVILKVCGRADGDGIIKAACPTTTMKFLVSRMEQLLKVFRDHEQKTGRQSGLLMVLDFDGLVLNETLLRLVNGPLKVLLMSYTLHYAEFMQKTICINIPSYIYYLYQLLKPVLPEKTGRKVIFLGSNWKEEILKYIDADVLPVHWGGTVVDPDGDPKCPSNVVIADTVDPSDYWVPDQNDPPKKELKVFVVNAWKYDYLTFHVNKSASILEWYFFTNKDYGFGIFYTENEFETNADKMEMVYPQVDRMTGPNMVPERDKITCEKPGFYKLRFNNDFSWMNKLKIRYRVVCNSPE